MTWDQGVAPPGAQSRTRSTTAHGSVWQRLDEAAARWAAGLFAPDDARARAEGWQVESSSRWSRTYRDPRFPRVVSLDDGDGFGSRS